MTIRMLSADDKHAEIKRLYYNATRQTIQQDLEKAVGLLKSMANEDERDRAAVYMDGLAQMRSEWARADRANAKGHRAKATGHRAQGKRPTVKGKGQTAKGKEQGVEGKGPKAKGKRPRAEGHWQKAEAKKRTEE